jgi:hypothetical protein
MITPAPQSAASHAFAGIAWAANAPPSNVMNSRRLMGLPEARDQG